MGRTDSGVFLKDIGGSQQLVVTGFQFQTINKGLTLLCAEQDASIKLESLVKRITKANSCLAFVFNIFDSDTIYLQFIDSGRVSSYCSLANDFDASVKKDFPIEFCEFFCLEEEDAKLVRQILKLRDPELSYEYLEALAGVHFESIRNPADQKSIGKTKDVIAKEIKSLLKANKVPVLKVVETVTISARCSRHALGRFLLILQQETFNSWTYDQYELFRLNENAAPELIVPKSVFSFCDDDLLLMAGNQLYVFRNIPKCQPAAQIEKHLGLFKVDVERRTIAEVRLPDGSDYVTAIAQDLGLTPEATLETIEQNAPQVFINHKSVGPLKIDSYIDRFRVLEESGKVIGKVPIRGVSVINYLDEGNYLHIVVSEEKNQFLGQFPHNITGVKCMQYLHFKKVVIPHLTRLLEKSIVGKEGFTF